MPDGHDTDHKQMNPLIGSIASALNTDDIESRIRRSPLDGIDDVSALSTENRRDLLDKMQEYLFEPTTMTLHLCTRLFRMIKRGYMSRDPRLLAVRKQSLGISNYGGSQISDLPWLDSYAKCMRVDGETGTGKTHEVRNALRIIPNPIIHQESRECGWAHFVQITWLYVSMSHDGSLGGLLLNVLTSIDQTIGTKYSYQPSLSRMSNEKLAVHVGIILRNHAVGVLVFDEIQERNFTGAHGELAALFFLRLLNFGIPLLLMGNPRGLAALDQFSQDVRRTGSAGSINFEPHDIGDFDWTNCIAPRLWKYYVLPDAMTFSDPEGSILFRYSGGIRDYASRIIIAAQHLALDLGDTALTEEHLEMVYRGSDYLDKDRDMIEGFAQRDPMRLMHFKDVRVQHFRRKWEEMRHAPVDAYLHESGARSPAPSSQEPSDPCMSAPSKPVRTRHKVEMATAKGIATRRNNEITKRTGVRDSCDKGDMRNGGLQDFLIAGLDELREDE